MNDSAVKTECLSEELLSRLAGIVSDRIGLHFPPYRRQDFLRGIDAVAGEFEFDDVRSCVDWLLSSRWNRSQVEALASCLTIGETYFFRNEGDVALLRETIIPTLVRTRRDREKTLRFWSAGSCTGEEPYTIAMLLQENLPDIDDWNITILGTDINPRFLRKAAEGVFGEWSFRNTPDDVKERYFRQTGKGRYTICPSIREMVRLGHLNLASDPYPSLTNGTNAMDVILCRNVLIYFTAELSRKVLGSLGRSLMDGGWLFVSPSDGTNLVDRRFRQVPSNKAMCFRKEDRPAPSTEGKTIVEVNRSPGCASPGDRNLEKTRPPAREKDDSLRRSPVTGFQSGGFQSGGFRSGSEEPRRDRLDTARTLFDQGLFSEAMVLLDGLCSGSRPSGEALILMAQVHANMGKLSEALKWCDRAVTLRKMDPNVHHLRAAILQETGRLDEAAEALNRVLYLDSDHVLAHFALGSLRKQEGKSSEADRYFANALDLLRGRPHDEPIEQSDGITAGRMITIIEAMTL